MSDIAGEARKIALQNAVSHGGRAREGAVLAGLLGARPELRPKAGELMEEISDIVAGINAMPESKQREELGDVPVERKKQEGQALPPLEGAIKGRVVTRFPPEPNGYPHIGHAKAAIINEEYVTMYGGIKILRMDDTNPGAERMEYYAAIKVGLDWLGIEYDVIKNTSDDMDLLLSKGRELLESGDAYVCTCKRDDMSKNRRAMAPCKCSKKAQEDHMEGWDKMHGKFKPGQAVARFRGDMESQNTVMRDPVLFRIMEERHPLLGDRHRVWPSYDMAVAIEDSIDGVTHAFRSKEYELRNELYGAILGKLDMRAPMVLEFSRLEFEGMPVSKRVIRPLIEDGKIPWYDDPRLPTLEGMKKRGITPGAIRRFVISLGLTKADTLAPFGALEAFNRKEIDGNSTRLFLVGDPRRIDVAGLPGTAELPNHPSGDMGSRKIETGGALYLPGKDAEGLSEGGHIRLMGLGDVRIDSAGRDLAGTYTGDDISAGYPKMQWVPCGDARKIKVVIPRAPIKDGEFDSSSLGILEGMVEPHYLQVGDGQSIQFVRFGYCRKESQHMAVFTHG
ncbi:glutamyl-tRNA synthetase [Cenarchaeum symbiosum A]|uniref:Glutamate--tRNA ligase n=1 Tax=Cenarchaeum symbiosum (strain A) TaxID=414004 RepID=SYE_CENSY|nr:RecName: Full=Glutamate--tRNA ligase; AltName: Full=Glutamyl-tRNA synthetase; Short=GluRS [Cenarchaeum symbiosum A]ABK78237.1 glutamyl-tRNA synthetase [Cenarchaeum symbiosum A]